MAELIDAEAHDPAAGREARVDEVELARPEPADVPQDFDGLRDLLLARKDHLPKRLSQVANFVAANIDEIAFGTVAAIAEAAGVQPSTLIRFGQALGYSGFSDLQAIFRDRLRDRNPAYEQHLQSLRSHSESVVRTAALFSGFTDAAEQSVRSLRSKMDPALIERAAGMLARAETIYLVGLRRSFPVTSYMSYAFGTLGVRSVLVGSPMGIDAEILAHAGSRDAALLVSFTPYASATVEHAGQLGRQSVPTVAVTDSPFSPLVVRDGIWFEVVERDFEGFRPLSATLALAMTLCVGVAELRRQPGS